MDIPPKENVNVMSLSQAVVFWILVVLGALYLGRVLDSSIGWVVAGFWIANNIFLGWRHFHRPSSPDYEATKPAKLETIVAGFGIFIVCGAFAAIDLLWPGLSYVFPAEGRTSLRLFAFVAVVIIGMALWLFRRYSLLCFGLFELAFALYIAWDLGPGLRYLIEPHNEAEIRDATVGIMTGSIYLFVQGVDNAFQGYREGEDAKQLIDGVIALYVPSWKKETEQPASPQSSGT
jgi:hypothetical protein